VVAGGCSVIGGITATAGLVLSEVSRNPAPDTVASALIGLLLLLASVLLLRTNRDLLSGRGVAPPMLREMSQLIAEQPGVVAVPDLLGPGGRDVTGRVLKAGNGQISVPRTWQPGTPFPLPPLMSPAAADALLPRVLASATP
jgi:hypothetical protein